MSTSFICHRSKKRKLLNFDKQPFMEIKTSNLGLNFADKLAPMYLHLLQFTLDLHTYVFFSTVYAYAFVRRAEVGRLEQNDNLIMF